MVQSRSSSKGDGNTGGYNSVAAGMIVRKADIFSIADHINDLTTLVTGELLTPNEAAAELRRIHRMMINLTTRQTGTARL